MKQAVFTMTEEETTKALTPMRPGRRADGTMLPGYSANPGGVAKNPPSHGMLVALENAIDPAALAEKVVKGAMDGSEMMQIYLYNRICGSPVQRHEAKLQHEVDNTSAILAERFGLSVEDIRRKAKAIASGA